MPDSLQHRIAEALIERHRGHQYDAFCALCRGDTNVLSVVATQAVREWLASEAVREAVEDAIWHGTYTHPMPSKEPSSDRYWLNVMTDGALDALTEQAGEQG